jgi:hypothetical protein
MKSGHGDNGTAVVVGLVKVTLYRRTDPMTIAAGAAMVAVSEASEPGSVTLSMKP